MFIYIHVQVIHCPVYLLMLTIFNMQIIILLTILSYISTVSTDHSAPSFSPAPDDLILTSLDDLDNEDIVLSKPLMRTPVTLETVSMSQHSPSPFQPWNASSAASLRGGTQGPGISRQGNNNGDHYQNGNHSGHLSCHGNLDNDMALDENLNTREQWNKDKRHNLSRCKMDCHDVNENYFRHNGNTNCSVMKHPRSATEHWDRLLRKAGFGLQSLRSSASHVKHTTTRPVFKDSKIGLERDNSFNEIHRRQEFNIYNLHPLLKGQNIGFVRPLQRSSQPVQCGSVTSTNEALPPTTNGVNKTDVTWARVVGKLPTNLKAERRHVKTN